MDADEAMGVVEDVECPLIAEQQLTQQAWTKQLQCSGYRQQMES
jgi:hypothetical protein